MISWAAYLVEAAVASLFLASAVGLSKNRASGRWLGWAATGVLALASWLLVEPSQPWAKPRRGAAARLGRLPAGVVELHPRESSHHRAGRDEARFALRVDSDRPGAVESARLPMATSSAGSGADRPDGCPKRVVGHESVDRSLEAQGYGARGFLERDVDPSSVSSPTLAVLGAATLVDIALRLRARPGGAESARDRGERTRGSSSRADARCARGEGQGECRSMPHAAKPTPFGVDGRARARECGAAPMRERR
jgi:hypothetical protein